MSFELFIYLSKLTRALATSSWIEIEAIPLEAADYRYIGFIGSVSQKSLLLNGDCKLADIHELRLVTVF